MFVCVRALPEKLAGDGSCGNGPVIAQNHQVKEQFLQTLAGTVFHRRDGCAKRVQNHKIGLVTGAEITGLVFLLQNPGIAQCGQIEGQPGCQCLAPEPAHLVGLCHGGQHGQAGAAADV